MSKLIYEIATGAVDGVLSDFGSYAAAGNTSIRPDLRNPKYAWVPWSGPVPIGAVMDVVNKVLVADPSYRPPNGYKLNDQWQLAFASS